jgi:TRAP-type C4-dicarboxylate transport system substrate-binding protein
MGGALVCAAVIATTVLALAGTATADERRIATLAPVGSPWLTIMQRGAAAIADRTDGRIKVKLYPGGVQGDEKDVVRKMRLEQLDGAALTAVGLSKIYPGIRVLQLPFLFDTEEEVAYVVDKVWPYFQAKFQERGFRLQSPGGGGWEYFYTKREVSSLADLRQVKMWAWADDPVMNALFRELKLQAVPLGAPELVGALKTGRVDGCYGPPLAAVALQWYHDISHASSLPISYTVGANVVRYEVWDTASDADKKIEQQVLTKMSQMLLSRTATDNARAMAAMTKAGVTRFEADGALEAALRGAAEATWKQLVGDVYTDEELEMVLRYRAEFRSRSANAAGVGAGARASAP